ncbi:MAG: hypothetical protein IIC83_02910 [Chloroflexi bacterium]|nr:hypothetical protein [Chloroflexota bacterium]
MVPDGDVVSLKFQSEDSGLRAHQPDSRYIIMPSIGFRQRLLSWESVLSYPLHEDPDGDHDGDGDDSPEHHGVAGVI